MSQLVRRGVAVLLAVLLVTTAFAPVALAKRDGCTISWGPRPPPDGGDCPEGDITDGHRGIFGGFG